MPNVQLQIYDTAILGMCHSSRDVMYNGVSYFMYGEGHLEHSKQNLSTLTKPKLDRKLGKNLKHHHLLLNSVLGSEIMLNL